MSAFEVIITSPGAIDVSPIQTPAPGRGEARIRTFACGISPGTELLAYRGALPESVGDDAALDPHAGDQTYPMATGYCLVGAVDSIGDGASSCWLGQRVFAFHAHTTHAVVNVEGLIPLPDTVSDELATFIPNLETAIGVVMDARPAIGERVVVLGQGIVGLLVTSILSRFPLGVLATIDPVPERRKRSLSLGAEIAVAPPSTADQSLEQALAGENPGADLVIELSGNPAALNQAISLAGYGGRVVAASWYGSKPASLDLGGRFHRNRISLISSQVSTIAPDLTARWSKSRRMQHTLRMLPELGLQSLISHRIPLSDAGHAFDLIDSQAEHTLQVVLTCEHDNDSEMTGAADV